jgi:L-threonylcarbamoyladenylate synthase
VNVAIIPASPESIDRAVEVLRNGGVVAYPTDTLYGLAVDPRSAVAVAGLFALKGRDAASAIPLIAASVEQARTAAEFSDLALKLAKSFWPGPLTIVLPAFAVITRELLGTGSTVALRVPAHLTAQALAARHGFCITSTSANRSGEPPATTAEQVSNELMPAIDLVLDGGPSPGGAPSTIVDVTGDRPRLVRAGAIAWERVLESLE